FALRLVPDGTLFGVSILSHSWAVITTLPVALLPKSFSPVAATFWVSSLSSSASFAGTIPSLALTLVAVTLAVNSAEVFISSLSVVMTILALGATNTAKYHNTISNTTPPIIAKSFSLNFSKFGTFGFLLAFASFESLTFGLAPAVLDALLPSIIVSLSLLAYCL